MSPGAVLLAVLTVIVFVVVTIDWWLTVTGRKR